MVMCNTSAAGHDIRPSVILLLKYDKVVLKEQYCVEQAARSIFLSHVVINYTRMCFLKNSKVYVT